MRLSQWGCFEIKLAGCHGIEKAHHIAAAVTGNGLVKRRDCSSGSIMARTLQGCKTVQLL